MSTLSKEVLRNMIKDSNLKTAGDIHSYLKDMFKDIFQEMLKVEFGKFTYTTTTNIDDSVNT